MFHGIRIGSLGLPGYGGGGAEEGPSGSALLLETGDYLLLEDGSFLLLEA